MLHAIARPLAAAAIAISAIGGPAIVAAHAMPAAPVAAMHARECGSAMHAGMRAAACPMPLRANSVHANPAPGR